MSAYANVICCACSTSMRYDALRFLCDSCACEVCPRCAGMDERDCDDPMPKVKACPDCVRAELAAAGGAMGSRR